MRVIAFRPRPARGRPDRREEHPTIHGTFRSPSGACGRMTGALRVERLVLAPRGAFVAGVFTGDLRDGDGTAIAVGSRRCTVAVDLVREEEGFRPWVRAFVLDLMGIAVEVSAFPLDRALAFPRLDPASRRPRVLTPQPPASPAP